MKGGWGRLAGLAIGLALVAAVAPADARLGEPLRLPADAAGCDAIAGPFVAFVAADGALVVLGAQPFPGGERLASDGVAVSVPNVGPVALGGDGQVFGLIDRSFESAGRRGCVAFDKQSFTWTSDLLTYVRWLLRDVVFRLPAAAGGVPALRIGERRVTLEVTPAGFSPVQLEMTEAGTVGLALSGGHTRYLFSAYVVTDEPTRPEVAVRVLDPGGPVFGDPPGREVAFVLTAPDAPSVTPTQPPFSIRLVGLGPDRYTIRPTGG